MKHEILTCEDFRRAFELTCEENRDRISVTSIGNLEKKTMTFGELLTSAKALEQMLTSMGIAKHQRVAVISKNDPHTACAVLMMSYTEYTCVLIDSSQPSFMIERLLGFSDVSAVILGNDFTSLTQLPAMEHLFVFGFGEKLGEFQLLHTPSEPAVPTVEPMDDVIAIIYSSGTTAKAKGIMITYRSVGMSVEICRRLLNIRPGMTFLNTLPLYHVAGWSTLVDWMLAGLELGIMDHLVPSKISDALLQYNPNFFVMVPEFYDIVENKIRSTIMQKGKLAYSIFNTVHRFSVFMRKHFGIKFGKVLLRPIIQKALGTRCTTLISGAGPCKESTAKFFYGFGLNFKICYASTETMAPLTIGSVYDRYPCDNVGSTRNFSYIDIRIKDPNQYGVGEILAKTPLIMKGYFRSKHTSDYFIDGYFMTGDLGFIDKKGYLRIVGRIKESIVLKDGKKVAPSDVERVYAPFCDHELICCGKKNEQKGADDIYLFIKCSGLSDAEKEVIRKRLTDASETMQYTYKFKDVLFVTDVPKTATGKVKRYLLAETVDERQQESTQTVKPCADVKDSGDLLSFLALWMKENLGVLQEITPETNLKSDIGIDSLSMMELSVDIEAYTGKDISPLLSEITDIRSLMELVEKDGSSAEKKETVSYEDYPMKRTAFNTACMNTMLRLQKLLYRFEVSGLDTVPDNTQFMLCPNHETHLDGMWVWSSLQTAQKARGICCLAKIEHLDHFLTREGLRYMGGIPTDRSGNTVPAYRRAITCVKDLKMNILIHPEGTRTKTGELGAFKQGAANLAIEAGIPIVPVCIEGAFAVFPPQRALPRLFDFKHMKRYTIKITFCPPIYPTGRTKEDITKSIQEAILRARSQNGSNGNNTAAGMD